MENVQVACLLAGVVLFLLSMARQRPRLLYVTLALLYVTFVMRELEVEDLSIPGFLIMLGSGIGKRIILGVLWILVLVFFVRHCREHCRAFAVWLRSPAGMAVIGALLLYVLALPLDDKIIQMDRELSMMLEEFLETLAAPLMLLSAVLTLRAVSFA